MLLTVLGWVFTGLLLVLFGACVGAGRGGFPRSNVSVTCPDGGAMQRGGLPLGWFSLVLPILVALVRSVIGLAQSAAYWGSIAAMAAVVIWVFVRASRAANAS